MLFSAPTPINNRISYCQAIQPVRQSTKKWHAKFAAKCSHRYRVEIYTRTVTRVLNPSSAINVTKNLRNQLVLANICSIRSNGYTNVKSVIKRSRQAVIYQHIGRCIRHRNSSAHFVVRNSPDQVTAEHIGKVENTMPLGAKCASINLPWWINRFAFLQKSHWCPLLLWLLL